MNMTPPRLRLALIRIRSFVLGVHLENIGTASTAQGDAFHASRQLMPSCCLGHGSPTPVKSV